MNHAFLQVFCAIFSGLMQGLAISNEILPFGSPFLGLFCLIPLYVSLYRAKTYRGAFCIFAVQTLTVHVFSSWWLYNFHGYALWSLGASALGTAVLGGLTGMVIFFLPRQLSFCRSRTELEEAGGRRVYLVPARVLWFAAGFVFWEWIKSTGFLAYPWGTLFMAAYSWKIMTQIADITGFWGITFVFTLFNATVAEGFNVLKLLLHSQNQKTISYTYRKTAKAAGIIICLTAVYGIFQYLVPRTPVKELNAVIVQQNIDPWEGGDRLSISVSSRLTEREVNKMRNEGKEPDLVLWSEGALTRAFPSAIDYYNDEPEEESLTSFIRRMRVPFLIGGSTLTDRVHRKVSNSAVLFDRDGEYAGFYSKIHMVPFAENVPFMDNPLMYAFMSNVVGMSYTYTPGNQYTLFKIPLNSATVLSAPLRDGLEPYATIELDAAGRVDLESAMKYKINFDENPESYVKFSVPICFEDAFPDVCTPLFNSGSEIFLNITNDSWSKTPSSEYQHFIVASFLAIEYRTTLVRCANAGYSVVVAPNGKILNDMDVFTEDAIGCSIPIYQRKATVFSILGDWFAYMLFAFMALYFAVTCIVFNFRRIKQSPLMIKLAERILRENPEESVSYPDVDEDESIIQEEKAVLPETSKDIREEINLEHAIAVDSTEIKPVAKRKYTRKTVPETTEATPKKRGRKPLAEKKTVKTPETKTTARKPATAKTKVEKTKAVKTKSVKTKSVKTKSVKTKSVKTKSVKTQAAKSQTAARKPASTKTTAKTQSKAKTQGRKPRQEKKK